MACALSVDLRPRVVDAIGRGMSRRQAAARVRVSAARAIRWAKQQDTTGSVAPKKQGGDRRSARVEKEAEFILGEVENTPALTLEELQAKLQDERGQRFGIGTLWRFFARRRITRKKDGSGGRATAGRREGGTSGMGQGAARSRPEEAQLYR